MDKKPPVKLQDLPVFFSEKNQRVFLGGFQSVDVSGDSHWATKLSKFEAWLGGKIPMACGGGLCKLVVPHTNYWGAKTPQVKCPVYHSLSYICIVYHYLGGIQPMVISRRTVLDIEL